jgi:hypothetical protein
MKKNILLALVLLPATFLIAQPDVDTVRPGIKSVKEMICGYSNHGDSTGLILDEQHDYNLKGRETKYMSRTRYAQESIVEMGEEEPEAEGYYYEMRKRANAQDFDTTRYTYNDKLQLVKTSRRDYSGKRIISVYTYNPAGSCTSEVFTRGGKEEFRYEWKYNANNKVISKWKKEPGKPAIKVREYVYDSLNRLTMAKWVEYYTDSTVYTYDDHDSLVRKVNYYETKDKAGKPLIKMSDSTSITRDANGKPLSSYSFNNFSRLKEIVTKQFDPAGRCIEEQHTTDGINRYKIVYTYDDSLHTRTYRRYGFSRADASLSLKEEKIYVYNKENELIEIQRRDGSRKMLERTVYQYTFY